MTMERASQALELLGGFTEGGGRKPLDYQKVCAPTEVQIRGDRLVWSPGFMTYKRLPPGHERMRAEFGISGRRKWNYREPSPEMLLQFVRLADAPAEAIRVYALRWGVLSTCRRHWLPSSHAPGCLPMRVPSRFYVYSEPIAAWRHFAKQAAALIRKAVAVRDNTTPDDADVDLMMEKIDDIRHGWTRAIRIKNLPPEARRKAEEELVNDLKEWIAPLPKDMQRDFLRDVLKEMTNPDMEGRRQGDRNVLSVDINSWLGLGNVRPHLTSWDRNGPRIAFGVGSIESDRLFGHLALQLLLGVSGSAGFVLCSACGQPYVPARAPAAGRLHYCAQCGIRAAWKLAQRRRREKLNRGL
jgi:hypothetical protein